MKRAFLLLSAAIFAVIVSSCEPVSPPDYADSDASAMAVAGSDIAEASKRLVVDAMGAQPGVWTSDIDAAVKTAGEKQLPVLLFFNGSDWSFAANSFVANVLLSEEWKAYAPELMLVMIDLPKKSPEFPAALLERNQAIRNQFKITDFPTVIFCDTKGTPLANLRANAVMAPAEFIRDIKLCVRRLPHKVAQMVASCGKAEVTAQYEQLKKIQTSKQDLIENFNKQMKEYDSQLIALNQQLDAALLEWSIAQLPAEAQTQARQALAENADAMAQMQAMMANGAQMDAENMAKFRALRDRADKARELINTLIVQ
jgi:hypothetical protein